MILQTEASPAFDIKILGSNVVLNVTPLTTASMIAAQTASNNRLREIIEPYEQCLAAGLVSSSLEVDFNDPNTREGMRMQFLIEEIAIRHIKSWQGVELPDGSDCPMNNDTISALMKIHPVGQTFFHEMTIRQIEGMASKKDLGVDATGISAAAPTTAKAVAR